jgi:Aldehyde dehydrogenase family
MIRLGLNRHLTHYHDLLLAANWAALGILYNTGQDCTAGSRVYVQDTIYDKFVTTLAAKAKELVIGDGFDEKSGGGPLVCTSPPLLELASVSPGISRSLKPNTIACGAISSLGRRRVPESSSEAKNAQHPVTGQMPRVRMLCSHGNLDANSRGSIHRHSP